jgi:hypothetical protein
MGIDKSENSLLDTVLLPFKEFFEPFGYKLDTHDPCCVYIINEYIKIEIVHRFSCITICLIPLCVEICDMRDYAKNIRDYVDISQNDPLPSSAMVDFVYMFDALEILAPNSTTEYERYPRNIYYLEAELRRQFGLICNHLQRLLQGNINDWELVRHFVQYDRGAGLLDGEDFASYIIRLKNTANEAYKNHEYYKAVHFYNALKRNKRISLMEYFRLKEAYGHTITIN